jgi:transcriptional regulator with XRE-family HTH domain
MDRDELLRIDAFERRQALADFLYTRRARLTPAEVGLSNGRRRRTPGLRREEVAELANIGVSWYTSLEQGRAVRASEQVLDSLAQALRLNADERRHLFTLAQPPEPQRSLPPEEPNPALQRMVELLDPNPAYVLGRRWDVLAWNCAADLVFGVSIERPPHGRNVIWRLFSDPPLNADHPDADDLARTLVAQFRADSARYPGDPWFTVLIDDLLRTSAMFREYWAQHDVLTITNCHKEIQHSKLGHLEFDRVSLREPGDADLKVIIYMALPVTAALLESRIEFPASGRR